MGHLLIYVCIVIVVYCIYKLSFTNEYMVNDKSIPKNGDELSPGNPFMVLPHQNKKYELEAVVCHEPSEETIRQYLKDNGLRAFDIKIWRDHVWHSFRFSCMIYPLPKPKE